MAKAEKLKEQFVQQLSHSELSLEHEGKTSCDAAMQETLTINQHKLYTKMVDEQKENMIPDYPPFLTKYLSAECIKTFRNEVQKNNWTLLDNWMCNHYSKCYPMYSDWKTRYTDKIRSNGGRTALREVTSYTPINTSGGLSMVDSCHNSPEVLTTDYVSRIDGFIQRVINIKAHVAPLLIGKHAKTVDSLRKKHDVGINVSSVTDVLTVVKITGISKENLVQAQLEIWDLLSEARSATFKTKISDTRVWQQMTECEKADFQNQHSTAVTDFYVCLQLATFNKELLRIAEEALTGKSRISSSSAASGRDKDCCKLTTCNIELMDIEEEELKNKPKMDSCSEPSAREVPRTAKMIRDEALKARDKFWNDLAYPQLALFVVHERKPSCDAVMQNLITYNQYNCFKQMIRLQQEEEANPAIDFTTAVPLQQLKSPDYKLTEDGCLEISITVKADVAGFLIGQAKNLETIFNARFEVVDGKQTSEVTVVKLTSRTKQEQAKEDLVWAQLELWKLLRPLAICERAMSDTRVWQQMTECEKADFQTQHSTVVTDCEAGIQLDSFNTNLMIIAELDLKCKPKPNSWNCTVLPNGDYRSTIMINRKNIYGILVGKGNKTIAYIGNRYDVQMRVYETTDGPTLVYMTATEKANILDAQFDVRLNLSRFQRETKCVFDKNVIYMWCNIWSKEERIGFMNHTNTLVMYAEAIANYPACLGIRGFTEDDVATAATLLLNLQKSDNVKVPKYPTLLTDNSDLVHRRVFSR